MFESQHVRRVAGDITRFTRVAATAALIVLSGCGGGGGGSSPAATSPTSTAEETGEVVIAVTDAEGDVLAYEVNVSYLRLERANGDVVETVPSSTRIDFAALATLTEFLTVATIPTGTYTGVVIGLDFGNADIRVQDELGAVSAGVPVDGYGNPLGALELTVRLPDDAPIRIVAETPAAVTLDFDLDASNTVDFTASPPRVTVEPFLFVTPALERDREHRVRGVLAAVDEAAAEITLKVRPFRHRQGAFGRFTFGVDDETRYDVDGVHLAGSEGLSAMAGLAEETPVVALGHVTDAGFVADAVVAGSSVPWADVDLVQGVVTARVDDTLTVRGVRVTWRDGVSAQRGTFVVELGDDTVVATRLLDLVLSKEAISVGQRVSAAGEMRDDLTLVANRVALHIDQLTGRVVQVQPLIVELAVLNGLRPATFDFSGTGTTSAEDADPARYEIDTATLALPQVEPDDVIRVLGLVNGFGMAPPDFLARTVVDVDTEVLSAGLWVGWPEGTAMPFLSIAPDRIDVDLSAARYLLTRWGFNLFTEELDDVALVAPASGAGAYLVAVRGAGELHAYREFADLAAELERQLSAGRLLRRIAASGRYNASNGELAAPRAGFEFIAP